MTIFQVGRRRGVKRGGMVENKIKTGRCFTWAHRGMRPNKRRRVDGRLMLNKDRTKRERERCTSSVQVELLLHCRRQSVFFPSSIGGEEHIGHAHKHKERLWPINMAFSPLSISLLLTSWPLDEEDLTWNSIELLWTLLLLLHLSFLFLLG